MADDMGFFDAQRPRNPFHHVRLLEQRIAVGGGLIGEAVAGEVEGDAAKLLCQDAGDAAPVVAGGREAVQEGAGGPAAPLVYEDAPPAYLDVAALGHPAAGCGGELRTGHPIASSLRPSTGSRTRRRRAPGWGRYPPPGRRRRRRPAPHRPPPAGRLDPESTRLK